MEANDHAPTMCLSIFSLSDHLYPVNLEPSMAVSDVLENALDLTYPGKYLATVKRNESGRIKGGIYVEPEK